MVQLPILNDYQKKADPLQATPQVVMNLIGNHEEDEK